MDKGIRIIKLVSGEEVIASLELVSNTYVLTKPAVLVPISQGVKCIKFPRFGTGETLHIPREFVQFDTTVAAEQLEIYGQYASPKDETL